MSSAHAVIDPFGLQQKAGDTISGQGTAGKVGDFFADPYDQQVAPLTGSTPRASSGGFFGTPSTPVSPLPTPPTPSDPSTAQALDDQAAEQRAARGRASTYLTSGGPGSSNIFSSSLLAN